MGHASEQFQPKAEPAQPEGSQGLSRQEFVAQVEEFARAQRNVNWALRLAKGNKPNAEDLLQQAAEEGLRGYDPGIRSVKAWMSKVLWCCANRSRRGPWKGIKFMPFDEMPEATDPGDRGPWRSDLGVAMRALQTLSPEQQQALLDHAEGYTVPEIAKECGVPMETIRSRVSWGRHRIKEMINNPAPPAP